MTSPELDQAPRPPDPTRRLNAFLLVGLLEGLGLGLMYPLLPFLVLHFGGAPALVTQLIAWNSLAAFVATPAIGRLSDRIGRLRVVRLSLLASMACYAGILLSWSLAGLFVFRIVGGLVSGRASVLPALVTDGLAPEKHVQRLSLFAAAGFVGIGLGPVLAAGIGFLLTDPVLQYRASLFTAIALGGLGLFSMLLIRGEATAAAGPDQDSGQTVSARSLARQLRTPLILSFVTAYAQAVGLSVTVLLAHARFGWGVGEAGLMVGLLAVGVAVARIFLLNRLVSWMGAEKVLAASLLMAAPLLGGVGMATSPTTFLLCLGGFSVAGGLAGLLPTALVSAQAPPGARGASMGLNGSVTALATFISAATNGLWFQYVSPGAPFLIGAAVLTLGFVVLGAHIRKARRGDSAS